SKVFKCPNCGYTAPRDWVGARNIMLRALQATAVVFQDNAILFQSV
ncbi:zinc ribbon domain-containing protein, partial [Limnospira platensis]